MVSSWDRTSFRFLSLTNTLTDKLEILMSSNGELDASNGTQQNDKEVRGWLILCVRFCLKPSSIFVIVFIDRSFQWNAVISQNFCIFIECCHYTVSGVFTENFVARKLISMLSPHSKIKISSRFVLTKCEYGFDFYTVESLSFLHCLLWRSWNYVSLNFKGFHRFLNFFYFNLQF